jgi:hypothetical protein
VKSLCANRLFQNPNLPKFPFPPCHSTPQRDSGLAASEKKTQLLDHKDRYLHAFSLSALDLTSRWLDPRAVLLVTGAAGNGGFGEAAAGAPGSGGGGDRRNNGPWKDHYDANNRRRIDKRKPANKQQNGGGKRNRGSGQTRSRGEASRRNNNQRGGAAGLMNQPVRSGTTPSPQEPLQPLEAVGASGISYQAGALQSRESENGRLMATTILDGRPTQFLQGQGPVVMGQMQMVSPPMRQEWTGG